MGSTTEAQDVSKPGTSPLPTNPSSKYLQGAGTDVTINPELSELAEVSGLPGDVELETVDAVFRAASWSPQVRSSTKTGIRKQWSLVFQSTNTSLIAESNVCRDVRRMQTAAVPLVTTPRQKDNGDMHGPSIAAVTPTESGALDATRNHSFSTPQGPPLPRAKSNSEIELDGATVPPGASRAQLQPSCMTVDTGSKGA